MRLPETVVMAAICTAIITHLSNSEILGFKNEKSRKKFPTFLFN